MQLVSGQKIALHSLLQDNAKFSLIVRINAPFVVDVSSFGIDSNDRLFHDDYMTFYNQPQTPNAEVYYHQSADEHVFSFDLSKINPAQTVRFVLCASVADEQATMQNIQNGLKKFL